MYVCVLQCHVIHRLLTQQFKYALVWVSTYYFLCIGTQWVFFWWIRYLFTILSRSGPLSKLDVVMCVLWLSCYLVLFLLFLQYDILTWFAYAGVICASLLWCCWLVRRASACRCPAPIIPVRLVLVTWSNSEKVGHLNQKLKVVAVVVFDVVFVVTIFLLLICMAKNK